jgi:hypothetical protein
MIVANNKYGILEVGGKIRCNLEVSNSPAGFWKYEIRMSKFKVRNRCDTNSRSFLVVDNSFSIHL